MHERCGAFASSPHAVVRSRGLAALLVHTRASAWAPRTPATRLNTLRATKEDGASYKELYQQLEFKRQMQEKQQTRYQIIAAPACEDMARGLEGAFPERFHFHPTSWDKFPDGTDNIEVGGFTPLNMISGEHVLFLASFHNNDVTLSQFQVMVMLLQSFIKSLTVVLAFYPVGTMERVVKEGQVATANTYAQLFSALPSCGRPTRLIIYDLHTLQNRCAKRARRPRARALRGSPSARLAQVLSPRHHDWLAEDYDPAADPRARAREYRLRGISGRRRGEALQGPVH